jgi:hypothetical protein
MGNQPERNKPMTTYRLTSTALIYSPGFIAWAIAGAQHDQRRMVQIISEGYGLPKPIAKALVNGRIAYTIDDEAVVFQA